MKIYVVSMYSTHMQYSPPQEKIELQNVFSDSLMHAQKCSWPPCLNWSSLFYTEYLEKTKLKERISYYSSHSLMHFNHMKSPICLSRGSENIIGKSTIILSQHKRRIFLNVVVCLQQWLWVCQEIFYFVDQKHKGTDLLFSQNI